MKNPFKKLFCAPDKPEAPEPEAAPLAPDVFAEEVAAMALALKMYQEEVHIMESTVITINRVSRVYSPWNSKIHGIPPMPIKK